MLPDIFKVGTIDSVGRAVSQKQPEAAAEPAEAKTVEAKATENAAKAYAENKTAPVEVARRETDTVIPKTAKDQVELQFSLNQEEKAAFTRYLKNREQDAEAAAELRKEDQELMKKAAERITKAADENIAKNEVTRQRVEKAVSEWYSVLTGDDEEAKRSPVGFIQILRQIALGKFDMQ